MITYSDKIDASYAKLKAVLAENAGAAVGFKSEMLDKSQKIKIKALSEEVVHILLDEIMNFVMHMSSATIDQISGRIQSKLTNINQTGLMLSDETIQKIKDALSEIPGASGSVAQVLNNVGKETKINDLEDFFDSTEKLDSKKDKKDKKKL